MDPATDAAATATATGTAQATQAFHTLLQHRDVRDARSFKDMNEQYEALDTALDAEGRSLVWQQLTRDSELVDKRLTQQTQLIFSNAPDALEQVRRNMSQLNPEWQALKADMLRARANIQTLRASLVDWQGRFTEAFFTQRAGGGGANAHGHGFRARGAPVMVDVRNPGLGEAVVNVPDDAPLEDMMQTTTL